MMRKSAIWVSVAMAAWLPGVCLAQSAATIKAGHGIAQKLCAGCHAIGMGGSSPHPAALPFRDIAAKGHVENLEEALGEGIVVGHPDMPQWRFGPRDVGALVAYLKSLSGKG
jgi:cytochrome c